MKSFCLLFLLVAFLLAACGPTGLDEKGMPLPRPRLAAKAGISLDQMGEGYWVFSRKCLECHEAQLPQGELLGQWHPVVAGMAGNAGLSLSEEAAVVNYIRAAKLNN
ncbi:hypothetical protein [Roseibacillus ishigakijimensis]|uniref:Cytochrome c domain-containing protein n=1 Tax=Roseibacillus ishigakijimensis TaxID=454146 RepID=A0A934VND8_9BACT|nr:hypothetical protein [Roseibacillus ishigakijimensis]MBK1835187.1 hypothetical protein [Roseibacillus ishigakijimensis]